MTVEQRDVFLLPPTHDNIDDHLFIVLSTQEANDYEGTFIGVMITDSDVWHDDFSFDLRDEMFETPLRKKTSHARMHLVTLCLEQTIVGKRTNRMKPFYFKQLMASIGDLVFGYSFKPRSESDQ